MSSATEPHLAGVDATPNEAAKLRIAHVGFTGTDDDRDRWLAARIWLGRDKNSFFHGDDGCTNTRFQHDPIDLRANPPRDFLSEQAFYDIVITHNLWALPGRGPAVSGGPTVCSPLHSPSAWKRRLQLSRAERIFMFGADFNAANLDSS